MPNNAQQSGQVNVADLNNAIQQTLIHIDLTKTFFSISPSELALLEEGATSIWKDITLIGVSIGVPCCINAIIENQKSQIFNAEIFWNSLVVGITMVIAIIFGIIWAKSKNKCKKLIEEIQQRPQYKMP
jgi:hypothetical protein